MDDSTATTTQPPADQATDAKNASEVKPLISAEDAESLFQELGMQNLPKEKKDEMLNTMIDTVMDQIMLRIEPTLTETDKQMLDDLTLRPNADEAVGAYLISKVPNLDQIAGEEVINYKNELKAQIKTIVDVMDEEAAKISESSESKPAEPTDGSTPAETPKEHETTL